MLNVLQRPEEMTLFARFSPPTPNQVVFQSKLSFFLISLNTSSIFQLLIIIYISPPPHSEIFCLYLWWMYSYKLTGKLTSCTGCWEIYKAAT